MRDRIIAAVILIVFGVALGFLLNDNMTRCAPFQYPDGTGQVCIAVDADTGTGYAYDPKQP